MSERVWRGRTSDFPVIVVHLDGGMGRAACTGALILPIGEQYQDIPREACRACMNIPARENAPSSVTSPRHIFVGNPRFDACEVCDQASWRDIHESLVTPTEKRL